MSLNSGDIDNICIGNSEAANLLLQWFEKNARDLPWRENYEAYGVMVSEFMLQQTQVDTVLPYFRRWMARFPDLRALASATDAEVEKLWEGLGYYTRARNLLKAARAMVEEGHEQPPLSAEELLRYPGFGPYTAGAVASIAGNRPEPAVDGNVERVTSRFCDLEESAGSAALKRAAAEVVLRLMPPDGARAFNQALMELGALICLPKNPRCLECPWRDSCLARKRGSQSRRPLPRLRPVIEKIEAWAALWRNKGRYLLYHRPGEGLWAGFWEIPWFPRVTENALADVNARARRLNIETAACEELGVIRFSFTRYRVTAWCVTCEMKELSATLEEKIETGSWGLFLPQDLESLTLPASTRKFLSLQDRAPWETMPGL